MTEWRPVSELTPEIVEAAWRLIVWDGKAEYLSEGWTTTEDYELDVFDSGEWVVVIRKFIMPLSYRILNFAVIDAPPEVTP